MSQLQIFFAKIFFAASNPRELQGSHSLCTMQQKGFLMRFPGSCRLLEETKRVSRILELTQLIAMHPQTHLRRELAGRFEVSERMIQKDLDIIRHGLKLPLAHSPGGYFFEQDPGMPALRLSFSEGLSLWLAINAAQNLRAAPSPELRSALGKIEALFPSDFCRLLRQVAAGNAAGYRKVQGEHRERMLMLLTQALARNRKVSVTYRSLSSSGQTKERVVHPYHLMPYVRSWQLIAHCELRCEVRMFKVDRILQASLLEESYNIPEDFQLEDYLGLSWGIIRGIQDEAEKIVLRFEPETGRRVSEEYWHKTQSTDRAPDGSILFRVHAVITPELVNWILYHGCRVEVLEPASLRDRVVLEHRKAAEVNGEGNRTTM